ncbi:MAG TPA: hypothetical protein VMH02_06245, partial [Verrucomicrobiae bacterium]|nr:hypothetical protein [Verrucomicrobiae bacterium]
TAKFTSGMNQSALALSNEPEISTGTNVPSYLQSIMGTSLPASASLNFMKPPDLLTILSCHSGMQQTIAASLGPTPPSSETISTPIPEPVPSPTAIPVTC